MYTRTIDLFIKINKYKYEILINLICYDNYLGVINL